MSNTGLWDEYGRYVTSQGGFGFTLTADSGTDQTVNNGETVDIAGGAGIATVAGATNTVTINSAWDYEEILGASGAFDITLSSISTWDTNVVGIVLQLTVRSTVSATSDVMYVFFNNDTTVTNYRRQTFGAIAGAAALGAVNDAAISAQIPAGTSPISSFGFYNITIDNPNSTNYIKMAKNSGISYPDTGNNVRLDDGGVVLNNTGAITRIQVRTDNHPTDLFAQNSILRLRFIK